MSVFILHPDNAEIEVLTSHFTENEHGSVLLNHSDVVLQWKKYTDEYLVPEILNTKEAVQRASGNYHQILQLNGIPTYQSLQETPKIIRKYYIPVFQLKELAVYQTPINQTWLSPEFRPKKERYTEVKNYQTSKEIKKVSQIAVRSIYNLGLDMGGVTIGLLSSNKKVVISVDAYPVMNKRIAQPLAERLKEYDKRFFSGQRPIIGADLEIMIASPQNKIMIASNYLPQNGKIGCDAIWLGTDRSKKPLVEFRPSPSSQPLDVFAEIHQLMKEATKKLPRSAKWWAGGLPFARFPIGGHIHFSQVFLSSRLIRALDNYLSLPLSMIESERSLKRRPRYGYLGDVRPQWYGGFEYRTPPSWLVNPTIAKGTLVLGYLIAASYKELTQTPLNNYDIQKAFYQGERAKILPIAARLWKEIEATSLYRQYSQILNAYKKRLFSEERWNEYADIRRSWQLPPYNKR